MAVTRWRPLEEYHAAVRLLVRYMWRQEPPLLPSGFADQVGLPRQLLSRWLQIPAEASGTPLPSLNPPEAVRLARAIGVAPHAFLVAAALATEEDPLFAVEDVWEYVLERVTVAQGLQAAGVDAQARGDGAEAEEGAAGADEAADAAARALRHALESARATDMETRKRA